MTITHPGKLAHGGTVGNSKLEISLNAACDNAFTLAQKHVDREFVAQADDLTDVAQGRLHAAGAGTLGVDAGLAARCKLAVETWEAAVRERADA